MAVVSLIDSPTTLHDSFGRHLHYLRVSLTDACISMEQTAPILKDLSRAVILRRKGMPST
jgi:3-deoxy-D-arabino-heptulosonate 7-phosphate (DAHP) synthase